MDSTILGAIIGAVATLAAVVLLWALPARKSSKHRKNSSAAVRPDKDDIYFMQFLLNDAYEQGVAIPTSELAEHHSGYVPLELESKLIRLEHHGYVKRTTKPSAGLGSWQISPKGVEFMLANGHQLQDLLDEQRVGA